MSQAYELEFTIEDYLVAKFETAMQAGGVLAVQSNPPGSAGQFGIQLVQTVVPPEAAQFPSIGIEFDGYRNAVVAQHTDEITYGFTIVVAVAFNVDPTQADTTAAARVAARNYVSDGKGNGMSPLLRSDRTLGGLVDASWIESLDYRVLKDASSTAGTMVTAWYRFCAKTRVKWGN